MKSGKKAIFSQQNITIEKIVHFLEEVCMCYSIHPGLIHYAHRPKKEKDLFFLLLRKKVYFQSIFWPFNIGSRKVYQISCQFCHYSGLICLKMS